MSTNGLIEVLLAGLQAQPRKALEDAGMLESQRLAGWKLASGRQDGCRFHGTISCRLVSPLRTLRNI